MSGGEAIRDCYLCVVDRISRQSDQGRLGLPRKSIPRARVGDAPYPLRLHIPGSRIVDLAAGGW